MRFAPLLFIAALLAGCSNENKVTIKGTVSGGQEGMVFLDQSAVDHSTLLDSTEIKRGRFRFVTEVTGPEFYQVRFADNQFVGLLVMPGENIFLEFGKSPLAMNYTVDGSPGSEDIRFLDRQLFVTKTRIDSEKDLQCSQP